MAIQPVRKNPLDQLMQGQKQAAAQQAPQGGQSLPVSNDDAKAKGAAPAPAAAAPPPRRGFSMNGLQRPGNGLKQASPHRIAALKKMRGFGR